MSTSSQLSYLQSVMKSLMFCTDHTIFTSNMTANLHVCRLFAGMWRPLVSVITTLYDIAKSIFHRRVWYRAFSLHYAHIRISALMILTPKFRFFCSLRWIKIAYSLTHSFNNSCSLVDAQRTTQS